MNKVRKKRSKKTLKKAIKVVSYEVNSFIIAYCYLSKAKKKNDIALINICLEAFLLHARNLYAFFYHKGSDKNVQPDDILAENFPIDKNKFVKKRATTSIIRRVLPMRKLNKTLAHTTYYTLYISSVWQKKKWRIGDIYNLMNKTISAFRGSVAPPFDKTI